MRLPLFSLLIALVHLLSSGENIAGYRPFTALVEASPQNGPMLILRKFLKGTSTCYLAVNPRDGMTILISDSGHKIREMSWETLKANFRDAPYFVLMRKAEMSADTPQNAGLHKLSPTRNGVVLSADLCPSKHPLDRPFIQTLLDGPGKVQKPLPLTFCVTGYWLKTHPLDLEWLQALEHFGNISITWVNHTYRHKTGPRLMIQGNFVKEEGAHIDEEIFRLEKLMIEKGMTPSIFFRFPGLVSNGKLFRIITSYGLIPIGTDAWIAKGEKPAEGSILLVHANGNEPLGLKLVAKMLKENRKFTDKSWKFLELRQSLQDP